MRISVLTFACAAATLALGAAAGDEALDPRAAAFYATPIVVADRDNATIGLLGLSAPMGADFMEYGRVASKRQQEEREQQKDPNRLEVVWDRERMQCWFDDYEPFDKSPECAPIDEAIQTLKRNGELLGRYRKVQSLPAGDGSVYYQGTLFISMAKLTAVEIKVDWRQGRFEDAYRTWALDYAFHQRMCTSNRTWVEAALCLVTESINFASLEALMFRAPQLIDTHSDELLADLKPGRISRYNAMGIARWEYGAIMREFAASADKSLLYPNYITNRLYLHTQEVLESVEKPFEALNDEPDKRCRCFASLDLKSRDPHLRASSELLAPAMGRVPRELLKLMHAHNRSMSLLAMRVLIARDRIPDADIPAYVAANQAKVSEPRSGGAMRWDAGRRVLDFDEKHRTIEVRL